MPKTTRWRDRVDLSDVALWLGVALIAWGLWDAWRPGVYLAPGIVLVWVALPPRRKFFI